MTPSPSRAHPLVCLIVWVVLAVATWLPVLAAGRLNVNERNAI
jgi:hypothetical protein